MIRLFLVLALLFSSCLSQQTKEKSGLSASAQKALPLREFPVNPKIKPCENFYQYACSKVIDGYKLRPDRSRHIFSFSDSADRILEFKKDYFKKLIRREPSGEREAELKNAYGACMNHKSRVEEEKSYAQEIIKKAQSFESKDQLLSHAGENIFSPDFSFIGIYDKSDLDRPKKKNVFVWLGAKTLPDRSYYEKPEVVKAYREQVTKFFEALNFDDASERAQKVVDFEKGVAVHFPYRSEMRELFSKRSYMTKKRMLKDFPNLKLESALDKVPKDVRILSLVPEGLNYLNAEIGNLSLEDLQSIYIYYSLNKVLDEAYPKYFQSNLEFENQFLGGPPERAEKHERCAKYVMDNFNKELDYVIVPLMFPNFPKDHFIKLAEKVRSSLMSLLQENKWLSAKAKAEAIRKIKMAKLQLVTPDNEKEWDLFPVADLSDDTFIQNSLIKGRQAYAKLVAELNQESDPNVWEMGPLVTNAYYDPSYNKFVLLLGILQYPFYSPELPDEANLGAIGAIVGHELGHAVDDQGAKYNADGQLKNWFSAKDKKTFEARTQKLIEQWNKVGEDGKFKLGENIGDLVGLTAAYRAAFPKGSEKPLEAKRDFFLQQARVWCGVIRPKMAEQMLATDPHSASEHRVNEQVKHQQGFSEAYQCQASDPMALPEGERIQVW